MDGSIPLPDVKEQLDDLLARVGRGEHIVITRDGKPVAQLGPAPAQERDAAAALEQWRAVRRGTSAGDAVTSMDRAEAIERLKNFSKGQTTGGIGWKALRDGGRKY